MRGSAAPATTGPRGLGQTFSLTASLVTELSPKREGSCRRSDATLLQPNGASPFGKLGTPWGAVIASWTSIIMGKSDESSSPNYYPSLPKQQTSTSTAVASAERAGLEGGLR